MAAPLPDVRIGNPGSGSKYMVESNSQIVLNNEPARYKMVHILDFGKRQCLTNIPG
jgi:hypothetical protein